MPKQVRFRRGTTAQHATFTAADGEVTWDTEKKCLVGHDGVTAGGKPFTGYLVLAPGNLLALQSVAGIVQIQGGDGDNFGLMVSNAALFESRLDAQGGVFARWVQTGAEALTYAASVNLDFTGLAQKRLALGGNLSLTATNMDFGKTMSVRLQAGASSRTLSFPAGWKFVGAARPTTLAASKTALLRLECFGMDEADVVATYLAEP